MTGKNRRNLLCAILMAAASMGLPHAATAEVEVSVTLTGPLEEIIPILHIINDLGSGSADKGDALEVRVHSSFTEDPAPAPAEAAPAPAPAPSPAPAPAPAPEMPAEPAPAPPPAPLAVESFVVEPGQTKSGAIIVVKAAIRDTKDVVDTVEVKLVGVLNGLRFDLVDNASAGDETAGDGIWTGTYKLPDNLAAGPIELALSAYDEYADPVEVKEGDSATPLTAKTVLTITE